MKDSGDTSEPSKDGKANILTKEGESTYTTRNSLKSTGGPTSEVLKEDGKRRSKIGLKAKVNNSMRFVFNRDEYGKMQVSLNLGINRNTRLPEKVFKTHLSSYVFFDYDLIYWGVFFQSLKDVFLKGRFGFFVLDPHPVDYFFHHFSKYGVFVGSLDASDDEYVRMLRLDPGGSPADALGINSNVLAICEENSSWAVFGERDLGLAVLATQEDVRTKLQATEMSRYLIFQNDLRKLPELLYFNQEELLDPLIQNYGE